MFYFHFIFIFFINVVPFAINGEFLKIGLAGQFKEINDSDQYLERLSRIRNIKTVYYSSLLKMVQDISDDSIDMILIFANHSILIPKLGRFIHLPIVDLNMNNLKDNPDELVIDFSTRNHLLITAITEFGKLIFQRKLILIIYNGNYENWIIGLNKIIKWFLSENFQLFLVKSETFLYRNFNNIYQIILLCDEQEAASILAVNSKETSVIWLAYFNGQIQTLISSKITTENLYLISEIFSTFGSSFESQTNYENNFIKFTNILEIYIKKLNNYSISYATTIRKEDLFNFTGLRQTFENSLYFDVYKYSKRMASATKVGSFQKDKQYIDDSLLNFYQKGSYNYNNETIKICTLIYEPFFDLKMKNGSYEISNTFGFISKLIWHLSSKMNFRPEIYQPKDLEYGILIENTTTFTGCIGEVQRQAAAFAAGIFTVTAERQTAVDFSYPIMSDPSVLIYQNQPSKIKWWNVFKSVTLSVWFTLLIFIVLISVISYVFCKYSPLSAYNLKLRFAIRDEIMLVEHLWTAIGNFLLQGQDFYFYCLSARFVIAFWWIYSAIFFAVFSADLTSVLTIAEKPYIIETIAEFSTFNNIFLYLSPGTSATANLKNSQNEYFRKLYLNSKFSTECTELLLRPETQNMACIIDYSYTRYMVSKFCNRYTVVPEVVEASFIGFVIPKLAIYKAAIDKELKL